MAVTSTITYCTDRDIADVYPGISEFDLKRRIYGWKTYTVSGDTYYVTYNSGLVTQLFIDGQSQQAGKQTIGTSKVDDCAEAVDLTETTIDIGDQSQFALDTFIKIDDEIMYVTAKSDGSPDTLTVVRGQLGTPKATHDNGADIFLHYQPDADGDFLFDSDNDLVIVKWANNVIDNIMEAGDSWATIKTRYRRKASRMVESLLDSRLSREIMKDREGNYPEFIIRATALKTVVLLLQANDPTNEIIEAFDEEFNMIIEGYKSGAIVLPTKASGDSSKGLVREVSVGGNLKIVEVIGEYTGTGYDLIKIVITTLGPIGIGKFSVYGKDNDNLKQNLIVTDELIDGDYQHIGKGLYVRFQGADETSAAAVPDEWEIEVRGSRAESSVISGVGNIRMTRR